MNISSSQRTGTAVPAAVPVPPRDQLRCANVIAVADGSVTIPAPRDAAGSAADQRGSFATLFATHEYGKPRGSTELATRERDRAVASRQMHYHKVGLPSIAAAPAP